MPPSERRNAQLSPSPSKSGVPAENTTYLKLEKPCVLFLEGSGAPPRRLSLPPLRSLTPRRRSLVPPRCAQPPLLTARRRVPLRPQRAPAPLPPLRPLAAGAEDSTSRGAPPVARHIFLLRRRIFRGRRGREPPTAHAAGTPRSLPPSAPGAGSSSPSHAQPAPATVAAWRGRPLGLGAWAG
jgi:hypothetical protein